MKVQSIHHRFLMTSIHSLPNTAEGWTNQLSKTFKSVDDALSTVVFSRSKCQLIANELQSFLKRLRKSKRSDLTICEISRLFEFLKATVAFVGIISSYQPNTWLSFFLNSEINQSFIDLNELWTAWSDCSTIFNMTGVFNESDALANAHASDLIATTQVLASALPNLPNSKNSQKDSAPSLSIRQAAFKKLEEIKSIIHSPLAQESVDGISNYILTPDDWEVIHKNAHKGKFSTVHVAKLKSTGQVVAVKELSSTTLQTQVEKLVKRELNSLRHVHHENLLQLIGVTITKPFSLLSSYCPNGTLYHLIRKEKFTPMLANTIALDIARAVEYLHAQGMIFRDLESRNILIDENNRAVLHDFLLTRMASPIMSSDLSAVKWMAPEIIAQNDRYDNSIDVYAYGMILYEMSTHTEPFHNLMPLQIASRVITGERPPLTVDNGMVISETVKDLITRCWAQNPFDRPSMHQIVAELEAGTAIFVGVDPNEYRQYARKTSAAHKRAMNSLIHEDSDKATLIARLTNLSPLDRLAVPTLQKIHDLKIENKIIVDSIVSLARQHLSQEVSDLSVQILKQLVQSNRMDSESICQALFCLWDKSPTFVIENLKKISKNLDNRQSFIRTLLTQKRQNNHTIEALEAIVEIDDLPVVFEFIDSNLVSQALSFTLARFGPVKEMIPVAVTSYGALSQLLRAVIKENKYEAISLPKSTPTTTELQDNTAQPDNAGQQEGNENTGSSVRENLERITNMLNSPYFMDSAQNLQQIIEFLSKMLHKGGPGYATLNLLDNGAKTPEVAQIITQLDFWQIIIQALDSPNAEIYNAALSLTTKLQFTPDLIRQIWEPLLSCFARTHSDVALSTIQHFMKQVPNLDVTGYIIGLLSASEHGQPDQYAPILFSLKFSECNCNLDKAFWRTVAKEIKHFSTAATAMAALFALKYQNEVTTPTVSFDFIGALLSFLYKQTAPFSCVIPVLQEILNLSSYEEVSVFLIHHHFIQYLHQMPLRYPNEPKVTNVLLQFASVFESVADSLHTKNQ